MKNHVVIVEGEDRLRGWLAQCLARNRFEVVALTSGRECLATIAMSVPQILLLDVLLSDMNGLELLRQIRAFHPRLPVLLVTGSVSACAERLSTELGASGYCGDPWRTGVLLRQIARCAPSQGRRRTLARHDAAPVPARRGPGGSARGAGVERASAGSW